MRSSRFRVVLLSAALASLPAAAQAPAAKTAAATAKTTWTPPKTSWGDPDLQGQWPATANIPMQRPASLGERAELTDEELAQRESQAQKQAEDDSEEFAKGSATSPSILLPIGWSTASRIRQASLVVDPPNGRIPPLTPEGQAAVKASARRTRPRQPLPRQGRFLGGLRHLQPLHHARHGQQHAADALQLRQRNPAGARLRGHPQ